MRLFTFHDRGRDQVGVQLGDRLLAVSDTLNLMQQSGHWRPSLRRAASAPTLEYDGFTIPTDLMGFLWAGTAGLRSIRDAVAFARENPDVTGSEHLTLDFAKVRLRAPLPRPGKILCSGINYRTHAEENPGARMPSEPFFFSKLPSCVIGPGEPIVHPRRTRQLDYEVEFAVVIGRVMKHTPEDEVLGHLFGYTILHDVSARDVQFKDNQITLGKNFDGFCPLGPCIVTTDEMTDPNNVGLRSFVNGQLMQNGSTRDWLFPLPRLLSRLSQVMTLEPGDVVSTGTPAGLGAFRKPPVFMKPGDVVRLEIDGIGVLENPVVGE